MIRKLTFTDDYLLELSKETQRSRFKVKKSKQDYRGKMITIEEFRLFKDQFSIEFQEGLNLIVGDNGTGKSSLLSVLNEIHKWTSIKYAKVECSENFSMNSFVLFDADKSSFTKNVADSHSLSNIVSRTMTFFEFNSESHGETMLRLWEYLEENIESIKGKCLAFDEPERGLSLRNQIRIWKIFERLSKENQVIICTHNYFWIQNAKSVYDMSIREWREPREYLGKEIFKKETIRKKL